MNKLFAVFLMIFSVNLAAESLQPSDFKLIKAAGIPVYSKAIFASGNQDTGFRFATSSPPEEVQEWYRKQLPKWALYNKYGGWILYDGALDKGMAEVMSINHISIQHNENLPQWFSLDKNMTTEIVIMIVK
ncbi:MAG: hypothetical protein BMS9Abin19_0875 [Gammaproteobacteria bacterium]|nr:MAG: hypothetical protein BMS9Abin19_0875 [Gammaproteobacteria bacterium]